MKLCFAGWLSRNILFYRCTCTSCVSGRCVSINMHSCVLFTKRDRHCRHSNQRCFGQRITKRFSTKNSDRIINLPMYDQCWIMFGHPIHIAHCTCDNKIALSLPAKTIIFIQVCFDPTTLLIWFQLYIFEWNVHNILIRLCAWFSTFLTFITTI